MTSSHTQEKTRRAVERKKIKTTKTRTNMVKCKVRLCATHCVTHTHTWSDTMHAELGRRVFRSGLDVLQHSHSYVAAACRRASSSATATATVRDLAVLHPCSERLMASARGFPHAIALGTLDDSATDDAPPSNVLVVHQQGSLCPGQRVKVQRRRKRRLYHCKGSSLCQQQDLPVFEVQDTAAESPEAAPPPCKWFGVCGGCQVCLCSCVTPAWGPTQCTHLLLVATCTQLQHVGYEAQLQQKQVRHTLSACAT